MVNKYKKLHAIFGTLLIFVSILLIIFVQPNISPEFTGSSSMDIRFNSSTSIDVLNTEFASHPSKDVEIDEKDNEIFNLKTSSLNDEEYLDFVSYIKENIGEFDIISYESFSPSISQELLRKSIIILVIAMIIIIMYVAFAFRHVSRPISSWKYGLVATIALIHDSIIPLGIFTLISSFTTASIDTLFITALLAILGYSINDTIVIFDRVRERISNNIANKNKENFGDVIDYGVRNSLRRSLYTSISTVLPLILLVIFVPVTQWFALALFVGIFAGTYSSLFYAPSLLLIWNTLFPQDESIKKEKTDLEKAEEKLIGILKEKDTL